MDRHNAALKVLFFEMLRDLKLADSVPPWYSRVEPKPMYEFTDAEAFWNVPVYAQHSFVHANRADARFVDHNAKRVLAVKMSCAWLDNRERKDTKKTKKYEPLRWKLTEQYPGYYGTRSIDILKRMQKGRRCPVFELCANIQSYRQVTPLNIALTFKVVAKLRPRLRCQEIYYR